MAVTVETLDKLERRNSALAELVELGRTASNAGGLQELVRAVRAGEALRMSDLRQATLIRRGELVVMTVGSAATFQISVKAEALQDGKLGEQIRLRNTESGRTLSAIVTGKGQARGV